MRRFTSCSEAETKHIGEVLGLELVPDGTALLSGELGSGKTVLVRGMARALGVDAREIQSPTFTLIHEHRGRRGRLVHIDLYRLDEVDAAERETVGLEEILAGPGVKAIEWAERLGEAVPGGRRIEIRRLGRDRREIIVDDVKS